LEEIVSDVGNQAIWSSIVSGLVFNPATAIANRWLEEKKAGNPLGAPVSGEIDDPDVPGGKQMAFSSGFVIIWVPNVGTNLV
jgi:hypothetical protein